MLHLLDVSALTFVHSTFSAQAELSQDVARRNSQLPTELPAPIKARAGAGGQAVPLKSSSARTA